MLVQPTENSTPHRRETRVFLASGAIVIVLAFALRFFDLTMKIDPRGAITAVLFLTFNTFLWSQLGKGVVSRLVDKTLDERKELLAPEMEQETSTASSPEVESGVDEQRESAPVRLGVFFLALLLKPLLLILLFALLAHASPLFVRSFLFGFIAHLIVAGGGLILSALSGHLTPAAVDSQESDAER